LLLVKEKEFKIKRGGTWFRKKKKLKLLKKIHDSVVEFEEETNVMLCTEALNEGIDAVLYLGMAAAFL